MVLPEFSRDAVIAAIREFDEVGRGAFLERYGFGRATKYRLDFGGRQYDSKAIVGAACRYESGVAARPKDFSGGLDTVVRRLRGLGFEIIELPGTSPDWRRDELILALDLYVRTHRSVSYSPRRPEVVQLSSLLRSLPIFDRDMRATEGFRTPASVALKLHNFTSIDPDRESAGMSHGGRADQLVWDEWSGRPGELRLVAEAITRNAGDPALELGTGDDEEYGADEGQLLYRLHRRYERDRELVRRKRAQAIERDGRLVCEVCGLEPRVEYGEDFADIVDVHHVMPLHLIGRSRTRLDDLAILCPTCHRAVHRSKPFLTPAELRNRRAVANAGAGRGAI